MEEGYPFVFVMRDYEGSDELLKCTLQYRFKSTKSGHTYIVRVEKYHSHIYCLKFFDKSVSLSKNKFSLRTNTFEPRTIFYTLYHIMIDVLRRDNKASFFFIGAEDEKDELGIATRRYRIYRRFVSSIISDKIFEHYRINELSLYILINKEYSTSQEDTIRRIEEEVRKAYNR